MSKEWIEYLKDLAKWYSNMVEWAFNQSKSSTAEAGDDDEGSNPGGPPPPPKPPGS